MPDERDAPAAGLLRLFRAAPFRLTLLSLALFAFAGAAFMAYVYVAAAGEARRRTDAEIRREADSLVEIYKRAGVAGLNPVLVGRMAGEQRFLYLLMAPDGRKITGSLAASPVEGFNGAPAWTEFSLTTPGADGRSHSNPARGLQVRLSGGEVLFVGADTGDDRDFIVTIVRGLWGAGALVVVLGIASGLLISRNFTQAMTGLTDVISAVRNGDLAARAPVRGAGDELDQLAEGLPEELVSAPAPLPERELHGAAVALITATGADFRIGGAEAFYAPSADYVQVPPQPAFHHQIDYYRTALHELGHWTGHASRLGRDQTGRFGSAAYAREELVAELASAFLCAALGIHPTVRHADYLGSWLAVLRADSRAIFRAASQASRAAEFLLQFQTPAREQAA